MFDYEIITALTKLGLYPIKKELTKQEVENKYNLFKDETN